MQIEQNMQNKITIFYKKLLFNDNYYFTNIAKDLTGRS